MHMQKLVTFGVIIAVLTAPSSRGLAGDTGLLFVSEQANSLAIVGPKTNRIIKYLKTSQRPRDMRFNANHTDLYVASANDSAIDVIDVAKLEVVGSFRTASNPTAFGINEKLRRIYVPNREGSSCRSSIWTRISSHRKCRPAAVPKRCS
jgi:DNA-binding beta-propeller fold protein YncE